jgi:hypothetical protein
MSPRLLRLDAHRIDALLFRSESVRFEACTTFRDASFTGQSSRADGAELCECGWLEADHVAAVDGRRQFQGRRPRRRQAAARRTA